MAWFAVRHVVKNGSHYEERVTLWERGSFEEAMDAATREAAEYVKQFEEASLLDPLQAFELADPPGEGRECWSLIRSDLDSESYVAHFFSTGSEVMGPSMDAHSYESDSHN